MSYKQKKNLLDFYKQINNPTKPKNSLKNNLVQSKKTINNYNNTMQYTNRRNLLITKKDSSYKGDTVFIDQYLYINGYKYEYLIAGNFSSSNKIVLLGGFPLDEKESLKWLVSQLNILGKKTKFMFYILSFPFFDNETKLCYTFPPYFDFFYSNSTGCLLNNHKIQDLSKKPVDPRFKLEFQSKFIYNIIQNLNINKAHFIGHGIGCGIFDHLLGLFPSLAISYSRSSYYWDILNKTSISPSTDITIGYPIEYLNIHNQIPKIFNYSSLCSNSFIQLYQKNSSDNNNNNRLTFIKSDLEINMTDQLFLKKISEIFRQLNIQQEIKDLNKNLLQTEIPIMYFQGEDDFSYDYYQTGFFPYYGFYNFFKNDIDNIYDNKIKIKNINTPFKKNIVDKPYYKIINCKNKSKINRFIIIPNSSYLSVIENPSSCSHAIFDFITSLEGVN